MRGLLLSLALVAGLLVAAPVAGAAPGCALPGRTGWTDEGHDTDRVQFQPSTGARRVLTLFVDFPDAPATDATTEYENALAPADGWLREASYGRVSLSVTPLRRWLRMPQLATSYGFDRGITFEQHELYVRQAVAAADPYADFSRYDLVYVVANRAASAITFSPTYLYDRRTAGVVADGTRVKWAVTYGQDMWRWGFKVAAHETGHTFGLPDLYAFTAPGHQYVGGWDVMGLISGPAPRYFGWHAWKLGWIDDAQVFCATGRGRWTVGLSSGGVVGGTKIAVLRTGETTAYVVESRRATGLDARSCSTGALVYRVDSAVQTGSGPIRVLDGNPGVTPPPGCAALDLAALRPGQSVQDGPVRVEVLSAGSGGDRVRVTVS